MKLFLDLSVFSTSFPGFLHTADKKGDPGTRLGFLFFKPGRPVQVEIF